MSAHGYPIIDADGHVEEAAVDGGLGPDLKRKLLGENAARLFNVTV